LNLRQILEQRLPTICAWLLPAIIFFCIFYLHPHWGLMDDVTNVFYMVPLMNKVGIFHHAVAYGIGDISWGMFRPTYPPMVYLVYAPGMSTAAWVTFAWNALLVCGVIFFYAFVLSRILSLPLAPILLASGAFFYGHDLLQHPSLQEKMVLLAGAGFTWHCWTRDRWKTPAFWAVAILWIVFGASVKASFAIHYCVAFMAFVGASAAGLKARELRTWIETILLAAIGVAMVLVFAYLSRQGSYTSQYSGSKVIPNLLTMHGPFFLIPILAVLGWCAWNWRNTWAHPEVLVPVTGVSAFLALFLPWGIGGYVQSVITPLYGAMTVQLCIWYLKKIPSAVWLVPLALLSIAVTSYRSFVNFGRLHDIGNIVAHAAEFEQKGISEIWMPCNEGSLSMDRFFHEIGSKLTVKEQLPGMPTKGKVMLYDQSMCTVPDRLPLPLDCPNPQMILPGSFPKSYRVLSCP
jgi:hypothetical protein